MSEGAILTFILAALAVPGVTSLITSALRMASDSLGIAPETAVYVASIIVTGVILANAGGALPAWAGDGPGFVAAWLALATTNAELARRVYETLLSRLYPTPA
jgi:hypothetical protein